ncbi:MAG: ABC transporter permease [Thermaurantiacus tibetensis]|uniref:ABC transporter permease n=1 Tax=Thermaurantiacus tibetensis TaxID=2759035 RepID=UPI002E2B658E|nr:ABC transporter permease [Thermaurantiacus tibetensis]
MSGAVPAAPRPAAPFPAAAAGARAGFRASLRREIAFLGRSPVDLALLAVLPLLLCALLSWQLAGGVVRGLPVAVVAADGSAIGRGLMAAIEAAPGLRLAAKPADMAEAERLLRAGAVRAAVLVPADAPARIHAGAAPVLLLVNASVPAAAATAEREMAAIVAHANAVLARERLAAVAPPGAVRPPPVAALATFAWNAPASQEFQLLSLLHPAILHLLFMLAAVSALGRELRDGTARSWAPAGPAALAGKLLPHLLVFLGWSALAILWLAGVRGWRVEGSLPLLLLGSLAMYLAYAGVALLLVGATRTLSQSLSLTGLYAGASFAFAGAIFPQQQANAFGRVWSDLLPFTHFARLVARTWVADAPLALAAQPLLPMLAIALAAGIPGALLYLRAARAPSAWGRR